MRLTRRRVLAAAVGPLLAPVIAGARTPIPPAPPGPSPEGPPAGPQGGEAAPETLDDLLTLDLKEDAQRRLDVLVRLEGQGPFPFLVDTGSERSVLSEDLARILKLPSAGVITVDGFAGSRQTALARVGRFEVGTRRLEGAALPVLPRRHLGALGLVGLDALSRQSIGIDFRRRAMEVRSARGFAAEPGAVVVRGRSRFGQLVLVDSSAKQTPLYVVLDTGAEDTMGNAALRALLFNRRRARGEPDLRASVKLISVTGQSILGEADQMPELRLGDIGLKNVPLVYAELETFRLFGLADKPSLMLGMDTLRAFSFISIDFARHEIGFRLPDGETTRA